MVFSCFLLTGKSGNSKKTKKVESSSSITTTYVCRDELDKKKPKIKKQVAFNLEPKYQHPLDEEIGHEEPKIKNTSSLEKYIGEGVDDNANNGVRVKIRMRKEDAARLLLKCREGGVLEFMNVAHELVSSSSVMVLSSPTHSVHGSLKAIPEEYALTRKLRGYCCLVSSDSGRESSERPDPCSYKGQHYSCKVADTHRYNRETMELLCPDASCHSHLNSPLI